MKPAVFVVAGNFMAARGRAMDLELRRPEWVPILDYHDVRRLRGLQGPLRDSASPYRVTFAGGEPRGIGDIIAELQAAGFVDANGIPAD